ncbi:extracellular matrix regulator RemB [Mangrovibacillus cuniculi]|uniref:DUF370 domain-containing protein n=1 Tax=Mangrovibacillus cuniculi TaxID=2593652 RepID=A0A7S8CDN5_9BACI|nr:extracellular matrix/biofilm biosynthesis regulator RemA family protein [Mangrovibacillus cuniculi]QPC47936.1 DUF370 domain-containing protein [Mangrovibacillus cuniculi]
MYIHIGGDKMLQTKDILTMIDYSSVIESTINAEFTNQHREKVEVSTNAPKTIIVTENILYYSPLATQTIQKRIMQQQVNRG